MGPLAIARRETARCSSALICTQGYFQTTVRRRPARFLHARVGLSLGIFIAKANGYTKCGPYLLTSSLAAALLDSLFEHPAGDPALSTYLLQVDLAAQKLSFSANC